jgi:histidinol-phosphatase
MDPEWKSRYELAVQTAAQAGSVALRYFDAGVPVELKADRSPVTAADREAEMLLRTTLLGAFPADAFLGEEFGDQPGTSGFRWIIDPVDGTRNFVRSIPIWATLVGLEHKGQPVAGVVFAPALGHTWRALRGDGAYRNDRPIRVSRIGTLSEATIFYTSLSWFARAGREQDFIQVVHHTQTQRGLGDFYGHVLVAQGSGELMIEHGVKVWDVAAIQPIVEEAGGRFSNWDGAVSIHRPDVIVSNGKVHEEVLRMVRGPGSMIPVQDAKK